MDHQRWTVFSFGVWYTTNTTLHILTIVSGSTPQPSPATTSEVRPSLVLSSITCKIFIYVVATPWTTNVSHSPRFWARLPFGRLPSFDHELYHGGFRFLVQTLRYPPRSAQGVQRRGCTLCEHSSSDVSTCYTEKSTNKFAWVKVSNCTSIAWTLVLFSSEDVYRFCQSLVLFLNRALECHCARNKM